jgi:hypothetical protein
MQGFIQNMLNNTEIYKKTMEVVASQIEGPESEAGKQQAVKLLENMMSGKFGQLQETELATGQVLEKSRLSESRTPLVAREQAIQSYERIMREQGAGASFGKFFAIKSMEAEALVSSKTLPEIMLRNLSVAEEEIKKYKPMGAMDRPEHMQYETSVFMDNIDALKSLKEIISDLVEIEKSKKPSGYVAPAEQNTNQQETY